MSRAADPAARQRAALIKEAMKLGWHIKMAPDGSVEATPPAFGPRAPQDPFELVDMTR